MPCFAQGAISLGLAAAPPGHGGGGPAKMSAIGPHSSQDRPWRGDRWINYGKGMLDWEMPSQLPKGFKTHKYWQSHEFCYDTFKAYLGRFRTHRIRCSLFKRCLKHFGHVSWGKRLMGKKTHMGFAPQVCDYSLGKAGFHIGICTLYLGLSYTCSRIHKLHGLLSC